MIEPDRIPCCIRGCRCSMPFGTLNAAMEHNEVMCRKHFRVDPELLRRLRRVRRLWHKADAKGYRAFRSGDVATAATMSALLDRLIKQDQQLWAAIKAEAQRRQDAGFFAPKPRRKGAVQHPDSTQSAPDRKRATRFEDQFQRLKRAMQ